MTAPPPILYTPTPPCYLFSVFILHSAKVTAPVWFPHGVWSAVWIDNHIIIIIIIITIIITVLYWRTSIAQLNRSVWFDWNCVLFLVRFSQFQRGIFLHCVSTSCELVAAYNCKLVFVFCVSLKFKVVLESSYFKRFCSLSDFALFSCRNFFLFLILLNMLFYCLFSSMIMFLSPKIAFFF